MKAKTKIEKIELDKKDLRILEILKENAKLTTSQIAKQTAIPVTTVHHRIKKLEKLGIIKNYTVSLDWKKLGKGITAYVLVTVIYQLPSGKKLSQEDIAKEIKKQEEVEEVSIMTGEVDIIVKIRVADIDALNKFIIDKLRKIDGVDKTRTLVVLQEVS